jgi:hypothetical protein
MGAMIFLVVLSIMVGGVGCMVFHDRPRVRRYLLALPVGLAGWLLSAAVFAYWCNAPASWAVAGTLTGAIATLAAPTGAWWFGAIPSVIVYGFGTVVGAVIWQSEGIAQTVLIQCAFGLMGGLITAAVRRLTVKGRR